jgi:hypothetical protein
MNIREEIQNILMEVFNEAALSTHFRDRVFDRLTSSLYTRPNFDYSNIEKEIDLIKKINFNPNESFAIQLRTFSNTFISKDPDTGTPSIGNEIWAVVRENTITTIFFRKSTQRGTPVSNIDNTIMFKSLLSFYNSAEKAPDGTVDFEIPENTGHRQGKGQRKKIELDFPMVEINGNSWYIDEANEELIYAKNIKKKLSFDDLKEDILEKVIDAVTVQSAV